jgi:hypothetical protein
VKERTGSRRRPRHRRRVLLFPLVAIIWTLLSCYPDPGVFVRNLARYRRLPIDRGIEERMGWELPAESPQIEFFVDSLLTPIPDWPLYRVPWYVPTAVEAARSMAGDCEAKAILLASLLAGKDLPYEIRASFNHIWVDYPGREARRGESQGLAYLEGEPGRLRLHWPGELPWREVLAVQREQLWDAMPLTRKALWFIGLIWIALALAFVRGPEPEGEFTSDWRPRAQHYLGRVFWSACLVFGLIAMGAILQARPARARWSIVDLREVLALAAIGGGLLAWLVVVRARRGVTAAEDGSQLRVRWSMGAWQRGRTLEAAEIAHLELSGGPDGRRPWALRAAVPKGRHAPLLHYRGEVAARAALRSLGRALQRPLLVRGDRAEMWTMVDEIPLSLRERAAQRPPAAPPAKPRGSVLEVAESDDRWVVRLPAPGRRAGLELLVFAAVPVLLLVLATVGVWRFPGSFLIWAGWVVAASLLGFIAYLAIILRGEVVAYLAGVRVEVGEEALRYHTPEGKVESVELERVESIELARWGEAPTVAVVSPERVLHIRGLGPAEHREWLRRVIEQAVIGRA